MASLFVGKWRLRDAGLVLLAALWLSPAPPARGQEAGEGIYYSPRAEFLIPFQMDAGQRGIRQVLLYVSEDYGANFRNVASAGPLDRSFTFHAGRDGWYWFTVQTQGEDNHYYPPDVKQVQPGLKVCVDTHPPIVNLRAAAPREGTVAVEWEIREENLDLMSMRLDYRPAGAPNWIPLPAPQVAQGQQGWTPAGPGPFEVRLHVQDKARNPGEATTTVKVGDFRPAPNVSEPPRGNIVHVKSRTFQLNYTIENIGPSDVKNVEVWVKRGTPGWQHYSDDAKRQGPYTITVQTEGRYGFTLIPRSGVGLADKPPAVGDQPQVWVEVDETKPLVYLRNIVVGRGADAGKMTVYWSASDRFLRGQPITISYSKTGDGQWTEIVSKVDNTGSYVCQTQGLPYEFYVRVEAVDEAGNVGSAQTKETIKVDLQIPKVSQVNVTPMESGTPPGGAAPPRSPSASVPNP